MVITAIWQKTSHRKPTGGLLHAHSKKQKAQIAGAPTKTIVGAAKAVVHKVRGGNVKVRARSTDKASVYSAKTKKTVAAKILDVVKNSANPHFIRENVITKGALIKTDTGLARVTSRPGQNGVVSAVLEEEK